MKQITTRLTAIDSLDFKVDSFFSALSAEKKTYGLSAHFASRAKRAVKYILSLTRIPKLGPSLVAGKFRGVN